MNALELIGLAFVGTFFAWYVSYYALKIGHGFSQFGDVAFAWLVINLLTWFIGAAVPMMILARMH